MHCAYAVKGVNNHFTAGKQHSIDIGLNTADGGDIVKRSPLPNPALLIAIDVPMAAKA